MLAVSWIEYICKGAELSIIHVWESTFEQRKYFSILMLSSYYVTKHTLYRFVRFYFDENLSAGDSLQ